MNQGILWLILAIIVALAAVKFVLVKKGKVNKKTDWRVFFNVGIILLIPGVFEYWRYGDSLFLLVGAVYVALGYAKRDEWGKK